MLKVIITPDAVDFMELLESKTNDPGSCYPLLGEAMSFISLCREDDVFHEDDDPDKCRVASITARLLAKCLPLRDLHFAGWTTDDTSPENDKNWSVMAFLSEEEQDLWVNGLWSYDDKATVTEREALTLEQVAERFEMPDLTCDGELLFTHVTEGTLGLDVIAEHDTVYFKIEYEPGDVVLELEFLEQIEG